MKNKSTGTVLHVYGHKRTPFAVLKTSFVEMQGALYEEIAIVPETECLRVLVSEDRFLGRLLVR